MKLTPGNAQWIGRRAEQQDAFGFTGFDQAYFLAHAGVLAVLADGMGGMSNGREASRLAVQRMLECYREKRPDESIPDALMRGLTTANRAVYDLACRGDGEGNVGTTLVAAAVHGRHLFWVAAGDSRLYLYRHADQSFTQCTQDHNYGNELLARVAAGELSRDAVASHPDRDALTSFLGMAKIPKVDANLRPLRLALGDRLLLCSDGIHGVLNEAEMKQSLAADAQAAADVLIAAVKSKALDNQDNATAALLACQAEDARAAVGSGSLKRSIKPLSRAVLGVLLLLAVALGLWHWRDPALRLLGFAQAPDPVAPEAATAAVPPQPPPAPEVPTTALQTEEDGETPSSASAEAQPMPPVETAPERAESQDSEPDEPKSLPEADIEGEKEPGAPDGDPSATDTEVPRPPGAVRQESARQEAGRLPIE